MLLLGSRSSRRPLLASRLVALAIVCAASSQCGKAPTGPTPGGPTPNGSNVPGPSPTPALPTPGPEVFVGAGDISLAGDHAEDTAKLLDQIGGTVFTLGDNAYPNGSRENFRDYDRAWGRHFGRTRPSPGNHEYNTPGAAPYFEYFGERAGPAGQGYYSFELGAWHIVSLNSNFDAGIGVDPGSPQLAWLLADLAASRAKCTLAYWHHPLFSSGQNGDTPRMRAMFNVLYDANADLLLAGHDHTYERFAPQAADGRNDSARGIREFVVGTGGVPFYPFPITKPNSEVRINDANGVLKLTLLADSYLWEFVTTPNGAIRDGGQASCH